MTDDDLKRLELKSRLYSAQLRDVQRALVLADADEETICIAADAINATAALAQKLCSMQKPPEPLTPQQHNATPEGRWTR